MTNINTERMAYLQRYYDNQLVTVEVPEVVTITTKGKVIHRFSGVRCGYVFKNGFAKIKKADVHLFENQHFIIHQEATIKGGKLSNGN